MPAANICIESTTRYRAGGISLNNLAGPYYFQGRYSDAEPLYLKALEMNKQLLGNAHPNTQSVQTK